MGTNLGQLLPNANDLPETEWKQAYKVRYFFTDWFIFFSMVTKYLLSATYSAKRYARCWK